MSRICETATLTVTEFRAELAGNGPDTGASRPDSGLTVWIRANAAANWCYRPNSVTWSAEVIASKRSFATSGKLPCTKRQEAHHHMRNVIAIVVAAVRPRRWTVALLSAVVILCTPLGAMAVKPKQVLLLHSFGRDFAPYDAIVAAFRTELAKGSRERLAVYDATLDAEQVSESDDLQPLLELLRHRFASSPPDVVVTIGPPAAGFYLKNRDKVFPGTPVVISALDERFVHKSALRAGDSVVAVHQDLPRLVDNILRVLPDTQTIAIVLGDSPLERFWLGEARKEFAQFANRVSIEWLNNLSLEQMRHRLATLPAHSAVLYSLMVTDAAGVPQQRGAALASLVEVSTAPIFSLYESELGHGVVGGPYHSQQRGGALTASAAPLNATITGLQAFFEVTLSRPDLMAKMRPVRVAQTLPVILTREEVGRLIDSARTLKHRTALSVAYGAGLRAQRSGGFEGR